MNDLTPTQQRLLDVTPTDYYASIHEIALKAYLDSGRPPVKSRTIERHMRELRKRGLVRRQRCAIIVGPEADDFASGPPEFRRIA